jgi:transposase
MSTTGITPITKRPGAADTFRRIEVITGVGRRRRWSEEQKAAIVAETLEEGAVVSVIAHRHGVAASQVFAWRKEARERILHRAPLTPVVLDDNAASEAAAAIPRPSPCSMIEIEANGARLRIPSDAAPKTIKAVMEGLGALKRRR